MRILPIVFPAFGYTEQCKLDAIFRTSGKSDYHCLIDEVERIVSKPMPFN